ncbi:MAG: hypothetical protein HY586_04665 [Candidatus Omnitrophica bacterium]|nr:hypothetical protein [Candidatus Omnitrophota bacterium]
MDRKEQDAVRYIRNIAKVSEAMPGSLTDTPIFFPSEDPEATDAAIKGIIPGQKQLAYTSYQSMKQDYRQRTVKATPSKSPAMYKFFAVFYVKERHILGDPEEIGAIEKTLNCGKRFQEGCPLIQKWEQAVPASSFPPDSELIPAGEVEGTQVQRLRRIFGERLHQQLGKLRDEIESLRSERWEVWELDSQAVQKVRKAISKLKVRSEIEARLWARWLQKEIDALSGHLKRTGAIPIFTDERISDRAPAAAGLPVPDAASRESNPRFWVNAICALILAMVHTTRFLDENGKIKLAAQNVLNLLQQSDAPTMDLFTALGGAIPEFYQAIEQSISLRYGHAIPQGSVLRDEKISSKAVPAFHLFFLHLFFLTLLMRVAVRAACEAGETNAGFIHLIFQKLFHAFWFDEMLNEQGYHFQLAISGPQDVPEEVSHSRLLHLGHALDREVRSMFAGNAYFVLRKMNMYFALEQGIAEAKNAVLEMQKLAPREGSIWVTGRGRENLVEIQREDIARQLDDAFPRGVRGEVHYSHIATLAGFEALDRQGVVDLDPDKNPELWKYWAWRYAHPKSTATPEDMLAIEKRLNGGRPFSEGIQLTAGSLGKVDLYDPETWPDQGEAGKLRRFFMWKKKNLGESGLHGKELKEALFENKQQLHRRLDGKGGHGDQVLTKRRTTFLKSMATKAKEAGFTDMPTLAYVEEVLAELHAATAQAKKNGGDSSGSSAASGQFMHDLSPPRKRGSSDFKSRGKSHWIPASAGMTKLPANLSNDELEEKLLTAALLVENDPHATTVLKIILEAAAKKESRIRAGDLQAKTALGPAEFAGAIELLRGNGHVVVEENGEEGEGEGEGEGERWVRWAYTTAADYKKRRDAISAFLANLWSEQPAEQVSSQANSPGTSNGDEARDRVEEPVFAAPAIHYASHEYVAAIRRRLGEALKEKIEAAEVEIDRRREELAEEWKLNDKHVSQMHSRMDTRIKDDMTEAALDARRDEILEMIEKDNYLSFVKSLPIFSSRLGAMTAPQESDDYQAWIDSVWALVLGMIRSAEPLVEKNDAFKVAMVAFYQILQNSREHYLEKEDVERFKRHIQGLRGYFDALFSAAHSENPDQASILKDGPDANGAFQYLLSLLDYSLTIASHNFSLLGQFGETRPEVLWAQYRTLVGGSIMASPESPQEEIPEQARQNQPFLSVELPPLLLLERKKRTEKMVAQVQEGFRTIFSGQACFWVRSEIGFPVTNAGHEDIVGDASLAETLSKGTHLTYRIARQSHHQGKLHARLPENARHKFWALYYFRMRYLSERNLIPFEDKEQIERNLNHGLLFREGCPIVERWIREMKSRVAANENLQLKGSGTIGVLSEEQASAVHSALEIMLEAKLRELNQEIEKRKVGWLEVCEIAPGSMKAIRDEIKKIRARKKVSAMRNKARQIEQDILALDLIRTQYLPLYGDDFPEDESLDVTARESDPNFWIHSVRVLVLAILKCSVSLKRYSQVRKAGEELLAQLEVLEARVMRRQFRPDVISETLQKVGQLKFKIGSAIITEYGNAIPQDTIFLDDKYAVNFKEIFNCLFWAVDDFVQLTGIAAVTSQAYGESSPGFFRFVFRILLKHFSSGTRDLSITFPQPLPQQNQTHPGVTRRMEKMRELLQQSWTTFMTDKKTFLEKRLLITVERGQFTKGEYIARIKELMGEDTGGFFSGEHDLDAEALRSGATPETLEDYLTPEFEGEGITREHKVLSVAFTKLQKLAASGQVDTDPRQNPEMWKYWAMRYVHPDSTATREELAEIERRFNGGKPFSEGIDLGANSANSLGNERLVDSRESSFRRGYGHKLETVRRVNRITGFVGADLAEYFPSIYAALLAQEEKQSLPSSEPIQIYSHPAYPAPACLERALHSRQLHQMA